MNIIMITWNSMVAPSQTSSLVISVIENFSKNTGVWNVNNVLVYYRLFQSLTAD